MPDGGTLTLTTRPVVLTTSVYDSGDFLLPGSYVSLTVSDTGVGMDEAVRQRVFEPFFTTKQQGTGLGLAMVHNIVHQSGGSLRFSTEPGRGTSFTVHFERVAAVEDAPAAVPAPVVRPEKKKHLIVVEDDRSVRDYVERILTSHGFRVAAFPDAETALRP